MGTAGVARVELVRPHWGVPFCKHRSWVARSWVSGKKFLPQSHCSVEPRGQQGKDISTTLSAPFPFPESRNDIRTYGLPGLQMPVTYVWEDHLGLTWSRL